MYMRSAARFNTKKQNVIALRILNNINRCRGVKHCPTHPVMARVRVAPTEASSSPTLTKLVFKRSLRLVVRGVPTDIPEPLFRLLSEVGV